MERTFKTILEGLEHNNKRYERYQTTLGDIQWWETTGKNIIAIKDDATIVFLEIEYNSMKKETKQKNIRKYKGILRK